MPTPRKYTNAAQRQAAYRRRTADALAALCTAKGLPGHTLISTMPSTRRWEALIEQARCALQTVQQEMQTYCDERSDAWQETERSEQLQERIAELEDAIGVVADLRSGAR
jgi:hypothetical protein